ncbi:MAG TPA: rhodanese-like domain-containing protein [Bacteroidia bacterium]|nr:rhodanese-like domain-containing protein [Bacteroidia bacterium]
MTLPWLISSGLGLLLLLVGGWYLFEHFWDRRLFRRGSSEDFVANLRAKKAIRLWRETPGLLVLDVRPAGSWRAGRVPEAVNAPFGMDGEGFEEGSLDDLDRERPVLVYCDGGFRSRLALTALREAGFRHIHHLHRGILSWRAAGGDREP